MPSSGSSCSFTKLLPAVLQRVAFTLPARLHSNARAFDWPFSSLMRAGWRSLFARIYKCGRCEARVPPGVSRNLIKENPANYKALSRNTPQPPWIHSPLFARSSSDERSKDSSRTKFQRLRLLPPEIIRSLSSPFRLPRAREGVRGGRERSWVSRGAQEERR